MDKYIGKLLGGRYEIIDVVGVGGMAVVYRARDTVLNRYVAVKILKDEFAKDPDIRRRFSIESQAVAKLSHHNIVSVYDVGNDAGADYIVMELIEGVTLKEYLRKKGRLSWQEALFFAQQICRALVHAHSRGIIHQDIKPQNIIILRDGTAKLTDFGIASFATTQETRVVQEAIGSVHYISPEQAKGFKIDYTTDIYSLGVVMYEMLTGKLPFEGETALQVVMQHINAVPLPPSELVPEIPQGMDDIVMHAMCANIARRYASAKALYADLERLKENADTVFHYRSGNALESTQPIGAEVRRETRRVREPQEETVRTRTAVQEPESFFDRLAERPGLAVGIAVSVFAVIALAVALVLMKTGGTGEEKISVPSFVGQYIDDVLADTELTEQFSIREAEKRVESDRPMGEILEQDPEPGNKVVKGTIITLTVSAGGENVKDTYKVTDFKGRTIDYITPILNEHGVTFVTEEEFSDEVEQGKIIRTEPAAGQELDKAEPLIIYISKGKENKETAVPDLYGLTESAARKRLEDSKLVLGSVDQVESTAKKGTVIWQSAQKDAMVSEGTAVNIQISKGKTQQSAPDAPDEPDDPVPDEPQTSVQTTGTANVTVPLPDNTDMAHVVIYVDGEVKYDQVQSAESDSVSVTLTAPVGEHEVTVSIDGSTSTSTYQFN